ncbi:MAG: asparagine synthase (glutamine-hydrolyzing) [Candidatus Rokuibacteriota bacterium]
MCGIAGIVDLAGRPLDEALVRKLCAELGHRGPDDEGYYVNGRVALGQRRLAILDVAGGRQPMSNEDGTVWVTFNGEIYNFRELRQGLETLGHRFATRSDTEVIVHAYEEYGPECVKRFRGMFAFGLWDQRAQTLLLARDRVGKKPLFYAEVDGQWVFASELQGLLQHPGLGREVDWTALDDYLTYGYVPAPKTIFKGVWKLPPAHYLTLRVGAGGGAEVRTERYWRLEYGPKVKVSEEEAAEGLLEVLADAVRLRMIADVPLGALLSGGTDSSMVVALMSQLSDRPVKTFSIGFDEQEFNELPYARLVAERYGTDHHEFVVRPSALDVLPTLVRHYGEPYADSSAIPTYYVAKLTRDHVKVALNGDGGDECFAGYERYLGSRLADRYQRVPALVRKLALEPLGRLLPEAAPRRSRLRQVKRFLRVAGEPPSRRYLRWVSYFPSEQKRALYTPEFQEQLAGYAADRWLLGMWEQVTHEGLDPLDSLLALDVQSYLPYDLLVKMDIATMANSLEARSPFLDHKVLEFCASLPSAYKLRGMTLKYLLKKVGARLLPREALYRRKMGFGVPVGYWMRGELRSWVEDLLLSPTALKRGYFQPEALRQLVSAHLENRQDLSFELWALLCLELWHREFLG